MSNINSKKKIFPLFCEGIIRDGNMYAFDNSLNAMCKVNLRDMSMDIVEIYESEEPLFVKRFFAFEDIFVLQQERTLNLVIYDTKKRTFQEYKHTSAEDIYNVIQFREELVFLSLNWANKIIVFDVDRREYTDYYLNLHNNKDESLIVMRPDIYYNSIIFPTQNENSYYQIRKGENTVDKISLATNDVIPHIMQTDGNYLWVIEDEAETLYGFGDVNTAIPIPNGKYGNIVVLEKYICLLPLVGFQLVIISKEDKTVRALGEISESSTVEMYGKVSSHVYGTEESDYIYLFPNKDGNILRINKISFEMEQCGFVCEKYERKMMRRYFGNELIKNEEKHRGLSQFIEMIR